MDLGFLPEKIKEQLNSFEPDRTPDCAIRGSGGFDGKPGESYIIAFDNGIYFFDRGFGDRAYSARHGTLADITGIHLEEGKFSSTLSFDFGGVSIAAKLSCVELENARQLPGINIAPAAAAAETMSPQAILVCALMFVAAADGEIAEAENSYIQALCADKPDIYNQAIEYYEQHEYNDLLGRLNLDQQQKLCCLANLLELGMSDGALSAREQRLIDKFAAACGISAEENETVRNVLLLKNQLSVLA